MPDHHGNPADQKIRDILRQALQNPDLLRLLREDPAGFAAAVQLSPEERERLLRSDLLVVNSGNPLVNMVERDITLHCITVTAARQANHDPRKLQDLSQDQLVTLVERVLVDPDYAAQVRTFVGL